MIADCVAGVGLAGLMAVLAASASASGAGDHPARLTPRPLGATRSAQGFFEYLPPGYGAPRRKWPLLVFLHGVGENGNGGSELPRLLAHGPLHALALAQPPAVDEKSPARSAFIILSPQHLPRPIDPAARFDCPSADEIHAFVTFAMTEYDVDPRRVYLTGLSCGAIGGWRYLGAHLAEQVTAAVLIAGDGRPAWQSRGCDLARAVAIWAFHGAADPVVPPVGTIEPMNHLGACSTGPGGAATAWREQRLTVYPGVGHDSWTETYAIGANPNDIYGWLLRFSKEATK